MIGGTEMARRNIATEEMPRIKATLKTFIEVVGDTCALRGLGRGQVPFSRTTNFIVVLNPAEIHLVVDDVVIG